MFQQKREQFVTGAKASAFVLFIIFILSVWTATAYAETAQPAPPPFISQFRFSDIGVILTVLTAVGGAVHKYLLRSIKKELSDFQVNLFTMLDQRYLSLTAHQMHLMNDTREHEQLRRDIARLGEHMTKLQEAMLLNDHTRPRVI